MDDLKTIFITGLHRSGTTILCMILGAHPQCIAVGEVEAVINSSRDRKWVESHYGRCTCGQCVFWPAVMNNIDRAGTDNLQERYRIFLSTFREHFPGKIPIDSSKVITALNAISSVSNCQPIRIVRDVRGWCVSRTGKITPRLMLGWYKGNLTYERSARNAYLLGYEELVLDPHNVIPKICEHIGIEYDEEMLQIPSSTDHILVGNRMRTDKTQRIKYDGRWMKIHSIWPSLLFPIMHYNNKRVFN
jgi:hypothetical protein